MIEKILDEIKKETEYQDRMWGHASDDNHNEPFHWLSYIMQYGSRWMRGVWAPMGSDVVDAFRLSMVKVAAIAVSAIASIDRQRADKGKTFYEQ